MPTCPFILVGVISVLLPLEQLHGHGTGHMQQ